MTNIVRELYIHNEPYGKLGEPVPKRLYNCKKDLQVGDLISFYKYSSIQYGIIVNHESNGIKFGIFGWGSNTLDFDNIKIVKKYNELTNEEITANITTDKENIKIKGEEFKKKTKKIIKINNESYGYIGQKVPINLHNLNEDLYVGDLVVTGEECDDSGYTVLFNGEFFGLWGWGVNKLNFEKLSKVLGYEHISDEGILKNIITCAHKKIEEVSVKSMTKSEIEKALGYEIEIVEDVN